MTIGATISPPSQASPFWPLNGVMPPSGNVIDSGAIVGGEDNDGVVGLPHVVELPEDEADIVVELLHADFV